MTQLELAEKASVKREHISNIELGKNSPAVKIITEIARALRTTFILDGCSIEPFDEASREARLRPVAAQLRLDFGVEYSFDSESIRVIAIKEDKLELRATIRNKRRA
jgi:transcriptional regulator with XRE-family HTH domain